MKKESRITYHSFLWEFLFENFPLHDNSTSEFIDVVEDFKKRNNLTLEQIFKSKSLTSSLRKKLTDQIKGLKDKINRTSVIMLHRPIKDSHYTDTAFFYHSFNNGCYSDRHINMSSLLTGDLTIEDEDMLIHILKSSDISNFHYHHLMLQYPHHGSPKNQVEVFTNLRALVNVISCGINNRYGHPHVTVIENLDNCIIVNERKAFDYMVSIQ